MRRLLSCRLDYLPHVQITLFFLPLRKKLKTETEGTLLRFFFFNDVFVNDLRAIRKAGGWDDIFVQIFIVIPGRSLKVLSCKSPKTSWQMKEFLSREKSQSVDS